MANYILIEAYSAEELNKKVTEALKDDYVVIGSPVITELFGVARYAQAVIKYYND